MPTATVPTALGNSKPWGRVRNPWSLFRVGANAKTEAPDFGCATLRCSPNVPNDRTSFVYNIDGSRHQIRGTKWENSMIGTRLLGKVFDNFDFTINYLFKRADAAALSNMARPGMFISLVPVVQGLAPYVQIFLSSLPEQPEERLIKKTPSSNAACDRTKQPSLAAPICMGTTLTQIRTMIVTGRSVFLRPITTHGHT